VGRGGEWTESYRRRDPVAVGISARSKRINMPAAVNSSPSATVILPSADVSPKVQMIIVNEGGHFMYREHPEQFNHDVIGCAPVPFFVFRFPFQALNWRLT